MSSGRVIEVRAPECGLVAFIVLDSQVLGPAAGGVRTLPYPSESDALADARRLARAMTLKCAISGLPAGGGKAVVMDHPALNREEAFRRLGEAVQRLGGAFRTAGDAGTTEADLRTMAKVCDYVHLDGGALSAAVARGLLSCLTAACDVRDDITWPDTTVAIQGCGAIGGAVAKMLNQQGAALTLTDIHTSRLQGLCRELDARAVAPDAFFSMDAAICSPCALGGVVTASVARTLSARIVCGAANNIMGDDDAEAILFHRGITLVPDVIASAGAVVAGIAQTVMGLEDPSPLIDRLGETTKEVLKACRDDGELPSRVVTAFVTERLGDAIVALPAPRS